MHLMPQEFINKLTTKSNEQFNLINYFLKAFISSNYIKKINRHKLLIPLNLIFRAHNAHNNRLNKQHNESHIGICKSKRAIEFPNRNLQNWWWILWFVWDDTNWLQKILHLSTEMPHRKRYAFLLCWHVWLLCISRVNLFIYVML